MLKDIVKEDSLLQEVVNKCNLTFKQLDYLLIQCSGDMEEKISDKTLRANKQGLSKSSFVITRNRGKINLKQALYSLIVAEYLGLLSSDCFVSLEKTTFLLKSAKEKKLSKDQARQIILTLEDLVDRILLV